MDLAYFSVLFQHLFESTEEKHGRQGQYMRYVAQSSHPWPPQYEAGMPTTQQRCSVYTNVYCHGMCHSATLIAVRNCSQEV
jgi:hypothetical protein